MSTKFTFIIPARMESTRFPNKPLKTLVNKTVLDWVYDNCMNSKFCDEAIIATDSEIIAEHCENNNKKYMMTGQHNCASNRVAEVAKKLDSDWVVEVQGDEPLLWAKIMDNWLEHCLVKLDKIKPDLFLSIALLDKNNADNPNFVKIVTNKKGKLLWISRSKIPSNSKGNFNGSYYRHTGFHFWNKTSLLKFLMIKPSLIEISEDTHATRIVENNFFAQTILLPETQAIDVPQDLILAEKIILSLKKNL